MLVALVCVGAEPIDPECFHCIQQFFECYKKNGCALKDKKHFRAYCKREYDECMEFCMTMLKRLRTDDFPASRYEGWWDDR